MDHEELEDELHTLRLKLKAARGLLRELTVAVARAEEALQSAQPKEAQRERQDNANGRDRAFVH